MVDRLLAAPWLLLTIKTKQMMIFYVFIILEGRVKGLEQKLTEIGPSVSHSYKAHIQVGSQ